MEGMGWTFIRTYTAGLAARTGWSFRFTFGEGAYRKKGTTPRNTQASRLQDYHIFDISASEIFILYEAELGLELVPYIGRHIALRFGRIFDVCVCLCVCVSSCEIQERTTLRRVSLHNSQLFLFHSGFEMRQCMIRVYLYCFNGFDYCFLSALIVLYISNPFPQQLLYTLVPQLRQHPHKY